jgi:hypothetical protein
MVGVGHDHERIEPALPDVLDEGLSREEVQRFARKSRGSPARRYDNEDLRTW